MSIVFYEYDYCKNIVDKGVDRIVLRDLKYLAMYWDYLGESQPQIKQRIEEFCVRNNPNFNLIQSAKMIKKALDHARKNNLRFPTPVVVTIDELAVIRSLNNYAKEKMLFSILVTAKFFKKHRSGKKIRKSANNDCLYSNSAIKDLKELAEVKFTRKQWTEIKHEFTLKGIIAPTRQGSNCWQIGFSDGTSGSAIAIDDYRNVIAFYQMFLGEKMIDCEKCGVLIKRKGKTHRMCNTCWKDHRKEKQREYDKRKYQKNKISSSLE